MRKKLLTVLICLVVAVSFVSCGKVNNLKYTDVESATEELTIPTAETEKKPDLSKTEKTEEIMNKNNSSESSITDESISEYRTETVENDVYKCTLSVRCDNIFENINELDKENVEILPKNGVIFSKTEVVFYKGESVFNVLKRELKKSKIHIDFVNTPMYNTVYIRGISNLYEHDCGELSGWIYKVNGKVPSYGCSQYILKNGDEIEFVYTCNLGKDVN